MWFELLGFPKKAKCRHGGLILSYLDFEKPIGELKAKIDDLKKFMQSSGLDLSEELIKLEDKLEALTSEVYGNLTPWQRIQLARQAARPTTLDYIQGVCSEFVEMYGDRATGDDPAMVGGVGLIDGHYPVTIVGHQKGKNTKENIYRRFGMARGEGYRKALRLMKQAEKFHRPVVCFIDTQGADPMSDSVSQAIASNLREMSGLRTSTMCFVTGEGASGGAIGLGITDRVFILENAWYSVISPESASSILYRDNTQKERAAEELRMSASTVLELGIADGIILEPDGGAHNDPTHMVATVKDKIIETLEELLSIPMPELIQKRQEKYRSIGEFIGG